MLHSEKLINITWILFSLFEYKIYIKQKNTFKKKKKRHYQYYIQIIIKIKKKKFMFLISHSPMHWFNLFFYYYLRPKAIHTQMILFILFYYFQSDIQSAIHYRKIIQLNFKKTNQRVGNFFFLLSTETHCSSG